MELQKRTSTRPMEVVLVANEKGGVGKTTTSLCLANCLTALGYRVLIADMDPSANLSCAALPQNPSVSLYDVFDGRITLPEVIVHTEIADIAPSIKDVPNLDDDFTAPVNSKSLTQIANRWIGVRGAEYMLAAALRKSKRYNLEDYYDFVILDSPPSDNILITNCIVAADAVIVPCDLSASSVNGLQMFLGSIANANAYYNTNVSFDGMLQVKYSEETKPERAMAKAIEQLCSDHNIRCYQTKIRDSSNMKDAMDNCRPILDYVSNGNGATDSMNMTLEFLRIRNMEPLTQFPGVERMPDGTLHFTYQSKAKQKRSMASKKEV